MGCTWPYADVARLRIGRRDSIGGGRQPNPFCDRLPSLGSRPNSAFSCGRNRARHRDLVGRQSGAPSAVCRSSTVIPRGVGRSDIRGACLACEAVGVATPGACLACEADGVATPGAYLACEADRVASRGACFACEADGVATRGACFACEADGEQGEWRETSETHLRSISHALNAASRGGDFASLDFRPCIEHRRQLKSTSQFLFAHHRPRKRGTLHGWPPHRPRKRGSAPQVATPP